MKDCRGAIWAPFKSDWTGIVHILFWRLRDGKIDSSSSQFTERRGQIDTEIQFQLRFQNLLGTSYSDSRNNLDARYETVARNHKT
jgi:hypothetical protein